MAAGRQIRCVAVLLSLLLGSSVQGAVLHGELLERPRRVWSSSLSGNFGTSNALVLSPWDPSTLYATSTRGELFMVSTVDETAPDADVEDTVLTFSPRAGLGSSILQTGPSGVDYSTTREYLVYATREVSFFTRATSSKVVALSPTLDPIWTIPLAGAVEGTPLVTKSAANDGKYILCIHNVMSGFVASAGRVSLVDSSNGSVVWSADSTLGHNFGKAKWAKASDDGDVFVMIAEEANMFYYVHVPAGYNPASTDLEIVPVVTTWLADFPPAVSHDGTSLFFGTSQASVSAWSLAGSDQELWNKAIDQSDVTLASPTLSADGKHVFVGSPTGTVVCLDSLSGDTVWESIEVGLFLKPLVVSLDGKFIIGVRRTEGAVFVLDAGTGDVVVSPTCGGLCSSDPISTSYALSENGLVLYYVSIGGELGAYELADPAMPSSAPSSSPSRQPTGRPSSVPSTVPTTIPSAMPSDVPSMMPSDVPSTMPSDAPSLMPSDAPSMMPSDLPSIAPSAQGETTREPSLSEVSSINTSRRSVPRSGPSRGAVLAMSLIAFAVVAVVALIVALKLKMQRKRRLMMREQVAQAESRQSEQLLGIDFAEEGFNITYDDEGVFSEPSAEPDDVFVRRAMRGASGFVRHHLS